MAATWTTHRERGHPAFLRLFTWIALWLGRPIARLLLVPIVLYFMIAGSRSARTASRDYLRRVLGREPRVRDAFRHVYCFAAVTLDRLYLLNDRHDLYRIEVIGADIMRRIMARGSGAFIVGAHLGSFEAVRAAGREHEGTVGGLRVSMVMYEDNARHLNAVFAAINPALAESIIALGHVDSMLRVKRALDDGGLVGMLADRTLDEERGTSAVRETMLLGDTVSIPTGPFRMAAMLRRPVVFMTGLYLGGDRYEVHYEELHDFSMPEDVPRDRRGAAMNAAIETAMARYGERLEHYCRSAPYNWFNFFDYWQMAGERDRQASMAGVER